MRALLGTRALLGLLLVALLASGCKSRPKLDIQLYPNGGVRGSDGNVEAVEGTLFKVKQVTPDAASVVAEFFHKQLVEQLGWTQKAIENPYSKGTLFTDDNLKGEDTNLFEFRDGDAPVDASKPGGQVFVFESGNEIKIRIWRYVPKSAR